MEWKILSNCDDKNNCIFDDDSFEGSGTTTESINVAQFDVRIRKLTNLNPGKNKTSVKSINGTKIGGNINMKMYLSV